MSTVTVKVVRAFLHQGERQEVGALVDVSPGLAGMLVYNGQAERADGKPAARRGAMTTASASAIVQGAKPETKAPETKGKAK